MFREADLTLEYIWMYIPSLLENVIICVTVHKCCCVYVCVCCVLCVCVCASDVLKNCTVPFAQRIHMHKGV